MTDNYRRKQKRLTYNTTLRLPEDVREVIISMAEEESRTEASMVRVLIEEAIRHRHSTGHIVRHIDITPSAHPPLPI